MLWVAGEVDLATLPVLEDTLGNSIDRHPAHLVVDLTRLQYCSAGGISALVRAGAIAAEQGSDYALSSLSPHLDRIWEKLWPDEMPTRYQNAATAVSTIRALDAPDKLPTTVD